MSSRIQPFCRTAVQGRDDAKKHLQDVVTSGYSWDDKPTEEQLKARALMQMCQWLMQTRDMSSKAYRVAYVDEFWSFALNLPRWLVDNDALEKALKPRTVYG